MSDKKLMVERAVCWDILTAYVDGKQIGKPFRGGIEAIGRYRRDGYTVYYEGTPGFQASFAGCSVVPAAALGYGAAV